MEDGWTAGSTIGCMHHVAREQHAIESAAPSVYYSKHCPTALYPTPCGCLANSLGKSATRTKPQNLSSLATMFQALHFAARDGPAEVVQLLLAGGANAGRLR